MKNKNLLLLSIPVFLVLSLFIFNRNKAVILAESQPRAAFTVNATADLHDANLGDGICETASGNGECTLRAAIEESNYLQGPGHIQLPEGTYTSTLQAYVISDDLTLQGDSTSGATIFKNSTSGDDLFKIACEGVYPIRNSKAEENCPTNVTLQNLNLRTDFVSDVTSTAHRAIDKHTSELVLKNVAIYSFELGVLNRSDKIRIINSIFDGLDNESRAIQIEASHYEIENSYFINHYNSDVDEATIQIRNGRGSIKDSSFEGNRSEVIDISNNFLSDSIVEHVIESTNFLSNRGIFGDPIIHLDKGDFLITDSEFRNNGLTSIDESSYVNGHIKVNGFGGIQLTIKDSEFTKNGSYSSGGVLEINGNVDIHRTTFSNNFTRNFGGAIYQVNNFLIVNESSIVGNHSLRSGGGYYTGYGDVTFTNTTISNNHADFYGGGIFFPNTSGNGAVRLIYSTLAENSISEGDGANLYVTFNDTSNVIYSNSSIISGAVGGQNCYLANYNAPPAFIKVNGNNNIDTDGTCLLDSLVNQNNTHITLYPLHLNGGQTPSHAIDASSTAIDSGDSTTCPNKDQRSYSRNIDGDSDGFSGCDVGAYEYAGVPLAVTVDGVSAESTPIPPVLMSITILTTLTLTIYLRLRQEI